MHRKLSAAFSVLVLLLVVAGANVSAATLGPSLRAKLNGLAAKRERAEEAERVLAAHERRQQVLQLALDDQLKTAGICPTCGQTVS